MTHVERKIHDSILTKLRERIALESDNERKAYLLGLEAGELLKGGDEQHRTRLQCNFEEAKSIGVKIAATDEAETWCVGYGAREFARVHGDPVLVRVVAFTKEEAERLAELGGYGNPAGLWAWREP